MNDSNLELLLQDKDLNVLDLYPENKLLIELTDARTLQGKVIPEINYIVEDILPEGLTILAGAPKLGKSWLALGISLSVTTGVNALGRFRTRKCSVLYLPLEDNERRLQSRINLILGEGQEAPDRFIYPTDYFSFPKINEGGIIEIEKILDDNLDIQLVVIDTLGRSIVDKPRKDGRLYNADYDLSTSLQQMAIKRNICVLILHHTRKTAAKDVFDEVSGTFGLTGGVDTIMILKKSGGLHTLHIRGRDVEETKYGLEFDSETFQWGINSLDETPRMTSERQEIYDLIRNHNGPMQTGEIAAALGKSGSNISKMIGKIVKDGILVIVSYGVYDLSEEEKCKINQAEQILEPKSEPVTEAEQEDLFEAEE